MPKQHSNDKKHCKKIKYIKKERKCKTDSNSSDSDDECKPQETIICLPGAQGATGPQGLSGFNAASLIPFSSGLLNLITSNPFIFPIVMGFGSSSEVIPVLDEAASVLISGFAFIVPADGVLERFEVTTDLLLLASVTVDTTIQFAFSILVSSSDPNALSGFDHPENLYTQIPDTITTISFNADPLLSNIIYSGSAFNNFTTSVSVYAGDRITVQVSASSAPSGVSVAAITCDASISYRQLNK
jgi:hypothetical protein